MNQEEFSKLQSQFTTMLQEYVNASAEYNATPVMINQKTKGTGFGVMFDGKIAFTVNIEKVMPHAGQPQA